MSQRIQPPLDVELNLAKQWGFMLTQINNALKIGRGSVEYGTAVGMSLTFVTAIAIAYGFDSEESKLRDAQAYLNDLLKRYSVL